MIKISIIIIVKNDRGIDNTLRALVKYLDSNTEIIVVDASDGNLGDIKTKYPNVNWINFDSTLKNKVTIPEQRNLGIKTSKGEKIIFIDANCIPQENWFKELLKIANENEDIIAGAVRPLNSKSVNNINNPAIKTLKYLKECPTINLLIAKNVFKKIGYFDENLEFGSDIDFSWRAIDDGFKIRNARNAIVLHDWGDLKEEVTRSYKYGVAKSILYKKHISRVIHITKYESITLIYPIFLLFLPVTLIFPFYPLLILIPLLKNYNDKPFKVVFINLIYGYGFLYGLCLKKYQK